MVSDTAPYKSLRKKNMYQNTRNEKEEGIGDPFIPLYLGNTAAYILLYVLPYVRQWS